MKKIQFRKTGKRNRLSLAMLLLGVVIAFGSCLKDDTGPSQISATAALNAVPGSEGLDIGLDNNQLNDRYWGEEFAYTDVLPYKNAYPGSRLVRVFDPQRNADTPPLAYTTVNFVPGTFYTLYVVGYDELEIMVTEDDPSAPGEGNAKIRFIQLSPDAPSLDIVEEGEDVAVATDMEFKDVVEFFPIEAGTAHTFNILEHGSTDVVHTFDFTPENNKIYTIWVKGLFESEGDESLAFGHEVITH